MTGQLSIEHPLYGTRNFITYLLSKRKRGERESKGKGITCLRNDVYLPLITTPITLKQCPIPEHSETVLFALSQDHCRRNIRHTFLSWKKYKPCKYTQSLPSSTKTIHVQSYTYVKAKHVQRHTNNKFPSVFGIRLQGRAKSRRERFFFSPPSRNFVIPSRFLLEAFIVKESK